MSDGYLDSPSKLTGISACVFDAYGTLFDVDSVTKGAQDALGKNWKNISEIWRAKQLQYTWLRGLTGSYVDFWKVTRDALEFALATQRIYSPSLVDRLMLHYLSISAYEEVPASLAALKANGLKLAILSNGSPSMLYAAVKNSGIETYFDAILSVDEVGVFKPHPDVYALAPASLAVPIENTCFISSNGWDAYCAKAFGFQVLWCNRFAQPPENIPSLPDGEIPHLSGLLDRVSI